LALYGPRAARLHEELLAVTARWIDPKIRDSALTPYARDTETRTLDLLYDSLLRNPVQPISDVVQLQLRQGASRDVAELLPHLESRGEALAAAAMDRLAARADSESKAMRQILENQQRHIERTVEKYAGPSAQRMLPGMEDELRQLRDNQRYWQERLASLEHELEEEPQRIADIYQVQAKRLEPVGLVYLWPVSG
ncbi:MAG: helicase, partial [Acidobacteria bacterium]|nr:helicase [Acidobacteriota bacterium]